MGAMLGAGSAPIVARAAMDVAPTLVSPMWDKAIAGAASVAVGAAVPAKYKAAKYGAYATGAVMLGSALADMLFGEEE